VSVANDRGLGELTRAHRSSYGSRNCLFAATQGSTQVLLQQRSIKLINLVMLSPRHTRSSMYRVFPTWPLALPKVSFDINNYLAQFTKDPLDFLPNFFHPIGSGGPSTYVTLLMHLHRAADSLHQSSIRRCRYTALST
jgi:hypothetical protein